MTTQQKELYDSQAFMDAVEKEVSEEIRQEAWRLALGDRSAYPIKQSECVMDKFCQHGRHHIDCPLFRDDS